jgi:hypothetical protein
LLQTRFKLVSDKIELFYERKAGDWQQVDLIRTGIASMEDKAKFKNPPLGNKTLEQGWLVVTSNLLKIWLGLPSRISQQVT